MLLVKIYLLLLLAVVKFVASVTVVLVDGRVGVVFLLRRLVRGSASAFLQLGVQLPLRVLMSASACLRGRRVSRVEHLHRLLVKSAVILVEHT